MSKGISLNEQVSRIQHIMNHGNTCNDCGETYIPMIKGLGVDEICPHCQGHILSAVKNHINDVASEQMDEIRLLSEKVNKSSGRFSLDLRKKVVQKTVIKVDPMEIQDIVNSFQESDSFIEEEFYLEEHEILDCAA